ncbi:SAM-dependent chlorinase/fluorinase [soil metagenome]
MARTYSDTVTTPAAARTAHRAIRPFVSMLSDFGSREPAAGIMRAVLLAICRDAVLVDLTHDVDKFAVRDGALHLWCAAPYLPVGTHVAVVDPGVGTPRHGIAVQTARGDFLVGPDNGLLMPAAARLGGITRVHVLESPQHRLAPLSHSFHGRDVFAPAAAHLATGVPIEELGRALDPRVLSELDWPVPLIRPGLLRCNVIYIDTFGNVKLSALAADVEASFPGITPGEPITIRIAEWQAHAARDVSATWALTFGAVSQGSLLLYPDSYGRACLAVNQGSAAALMDVRVDREVTLVRAALPGRPVLATGPALRPTGSPPNFTPAPRRARGHPTGR